MSATAIHAHAPARAAPPAMQRDYPLPPLRTMTELTLVARLSVGYEPPDPVWATMRMWEAVEAWEAVLESAPLCARAPANPRG